MTGPSVGTELPGVRPRAWLALEDGTRLRGAERSGAPGETTGEVVFNTALCGYQEVLTDPSYAGQIVTMTYPHIGNYGVNREDVESARPQVAGFVVREASTVVSSWRASGPLGALPRRSTASSGISEIDTRALTRHLRTPRRQARRRLGARTRTATRWCAKARALALDGRARPGARGHLREAVGLRPARRGSERGRPPGAGAEAGARAPRRARASAASRSSPTTSA